jgi:hypothetical protein
MNEILVRLAMATLLLSVSAVFMQALMLVLRPASVRVRQFAWFCVLIQGTLVFHVPVQVPSCRIAQNCRPLHGSASPTHESVRHRA